MNFIEKALGKPIERISTEDMDEMEKVNMFHEYLSRFPYRLLRSFGLH